MLLRAAFDAAQSVSAQFNATRFALEHAIDAWGSDADLTLAAKRAGVTDGQLVSAADVLELTFALRSFVQFEAVLRDYWAVGLKRKTRPDMRQLMDSVARYRRMSPGDLAAAHLVRIYRNGVAHGSLGPPSPAAVTLRLAACQKGLGRYLRWLPPHW